MGRRPDHEVFLVTKQPPVGSDTRVYTKVGVAWSIFDGAALNVVLNPGTVLDWRLCEDFYITIKPPVEPPPHRDEDGPPPDTGEDIPF